MHLWHFHFHYGYLAFCYNVWHSFILITYLIKICSKSWQIRFSFNKTFDNRINKPSALCHGMIVFSNKLMLLFFLWTYSSFDLSMHEFMTRFFDSDKLLLNDVRISQSIISMPTLYTCIAMDDGFREIRFWRNPLVKF